MKKLSLILLLLCTYSVNAMRPVYNEDYINNCNDKSNTNIFKHCDDKIVKSNNFDNSKNNKKYWYEKIDNDTLVTINTSNDELYKLLDMINGNGHNLSDSLHYALGSITSKLFNCVGQPNKQFLDVPVKNNASEYFLSNELQKLIDEDNVITVPNSCNSAYDAMIACYLRIIMEQLNNNKINESFKLKKYNSNLINIITDIKQSYKYSNIYISSKNNEIIISNYEIDTNNNYKNKLGKLLNRMKKNINDLDIVIHGNQKKNDKNIEEASTRDNSPEMAGIKEYNNIKQNNNNSNNLCKDVNTNTIKNIKTQNNITTIQNRKNEKEQNYELINSNNNNKNQQNNTNQDLLKQEEQNNKSNESINVNNNKSIKQSSKNLNLLEQKLHNNNINENKNEENNEAHKLININNDESIKSNNISSQNQKESNNEDEYDDDVCFFQPDFPEIKDRIKSTDIKKKKNKKNIPNLNIKNIKLNDTNQQSSNKSNISLQKLELSDISINEQNNINQNWSNDNINTNYNISLNNNPNKLKRIIIYGVNDLQMFCCTEQCLDTVGKILYALKNKKDNKLLLIKMLKNCYVAFNNYSRNTQNALIKKNFLKCFRDIIILIMKQLDNNDDLYNNLLLQEVAISKKMNNATSAVVNICNTYYDRFQDLQHVLSNIKSEEDKKKLLLDNDFKRTMNAHNELERNLDIIDDLNGFENNLNNKYEDIINQADDVISSIDDNTFTYICNIINNNNSGKILQSAVVLLLRAFGDEYSEIYNNLLNLLIQKEQQEYDKQKESNNEVNIINNNKNIKQNLLNQELSDLNNITSLGLEEYYKLPVEGYRSININNDENIKSNNISLQNQKASNNEVNIINNNKNIKQNLLNQELSDLNNITSLGLEEYYKLPTEEIYRSVNINNEEGSNNELMNFNNSAIINRNNLNLNLSTSELSSLNGSIYSSLKELYRILPREENELNDNNNDQEDEQNKCITLVHNTVQTLMNTPEFETVIENYRVASQIVQKFYEDQYKLNELKDYDLDGELMVHYNKCFRDILILIMQQFDNDNYAEYSTLLSKSLETRNAMNNAFLQVLTNITNKEQVSIQLRESISNLWFNCDFSFESDHSNIIQRADKLQSAFDDNILDYIYQQIDNTNNLVYTIVITVLKLYDKENDEIYNKLLKQLNDQQNYNLSNNSESQKYSNDENNNINYEDNMVNINNNEVIPENNIKFEHNKNNINQHDYFENFENSEISFKNIKEHNKNNIESSKIRFNIKQSNESKISNSSDNNINNYISNYNDIKNPINNFTFNHDDMKNSYYKNEINEDMKNPIHNNYDDIRNSYYKNKNSNNMQYNLNLVPINHYNALQLNNNIVLNDNNDITLNNIQLQNGSEDIYNNEYSEENQNEIMKLTSQDYNDNNREFEQNVNNNNLANKSAPNMLYGGNIRNYELSQQKKKYQNKKLVNVIFSKRTNKNNIDQLFNGLKLKGKKYCPKTNNIQYRVIKNKN